MVRGVFRFRGRGRRDAEDGKVAILTRQQHELVTEELALLERCPCAGWRESLS